MRNALTSPVTALLLLAALFLAGCRGQTPDRGDVVIPTSGDLDASALRGVEYRSPIRVAGGRYLLIPVGVRVDRETAQKTSDSMSYLDPSVAAHREARMAPLQLVLTNVVIHDRQTGESRVLLDRRALITRMEFPVDGPPLRNRWPADLLVVGVVERDTNKDGLIAGDDATVAWAVPLGGGELVRLTPEDEDFVSLSDDGDPVATIFTTHADVDNDGRFRPWSGPKTVGGRADEQRFHLVDLTAPAEATPLLTADVRQKVLQTAGISEGATE